METIKSIEEVEEGYRVSEDAWGTYAGFKIVTNLQTIFLGIGDEQSCCENWGYFITNDDVEDFIGSWVMSIDVVDTCLNKDKDVETYDGDCMYVNIETSKGTLQFTAYNEHNGYYGHSAVAVSKQLNHEETL